MKELPRIVAQTQTQRSPDKLPASQFLWRLSHVLPHGFATSGNLVLPAFTRLQELNEKDVL